MKAILKIPSTFLPLAMSFGAFATVIVNAAIFRPAPQVDEGTTAHIWQLLMAGQIPIIVFFAVKGLPRIPKQALAPVYLFKF